MPETGRRAEAQISTKAADSIWLKFEKKCKKKIIPKNILKLSSSSLKTAGHNVEKVVEKRLKLFNKL